MPHLIIIIVAFFGVTITAATATAILVNLVILGASLVIGAVSKLFQKDSGRSSLLSQLANRTVTSRQAIAPRRVAYGQNRLGGIITFLGATGANNQFLQMLITLAGHRFDAIPTMYFDGTAVPLDGSGNATGNFTGFVHAEFNLGQYNQASFAGLMAAAPGVWTAAHRQRGCAGVYVQLKFDQTKFPNGVPNITFDVNARQVYDPRNGNIAFSSNAALCIADYLNNARFGLHAQTKYALVASNLTGSGFTSFSAANAVDNDTTTVAWGTNPSSNGSAVTIDLGAGLSGEFRRFRCYVSASGSPASYQIERSDDAAAWTTAIQEGFASFVPDSIGWNEIELAPNGAHRYWRIRLTADATSTVTINEIEFYSSDVDTVQLIAAANSCDEAVGIVANPNDNFVRADGPPGTNWTVVAPAVYAINTNRLECTTGGGPMAYTAVGFPADQFSQATVQQVNASQEFTIGVRLSSSADTGYYMRFFGTEVRIARIVAGTSTDLTFWNSTVAVGDVLRLEIAGSVLTGKRNGVSLGTITDTGIASGSAGFYCRSGAGKPAGTGNMYNNWSAGGVGALTEPRYTIDGSFDSHELPSAVLPRLNSAMAGSCLYVAGKWGIYPAIWRAPALSLGDDDFRQPILVQTRRTHRDLFNGVKGVFISPTNNWQISDYPALQSPVFLAEDNNEPLWLDVELPFTISGSMAQRISKINLRRARKQITVDAKFKFGAYQAQPLDVIQLSHSRFGWTNKTFEVSSSTMVYTPDSAGNALAVGIDMQLRESDSQVYDWTINDQVAIVPPPTSNMPSNKVCQPPTGLGMSSTEIVRAADGMRQNAILVSWLSPADQFVTNGGAILVQYKKTSDTLWNTETRADGGATSQLIVPVLDGVSYDVRIWAENTSGVKSTVQSASFTPTGVTSRHPSYSAYRPLTNPLVGHDAGGGLIGSDDFARPNGAPGANWTLVGGSVYAINAQKIECTTGAGPMAWTAASFPNDQYSQAAIQQIHADQEFCVGARLSSSADTGYYIYQFGTQWRIRKALAGVISDVWTGNGTFAVGDVIRIEVSGSGTITFKQNGTVIQTVTDGSSPIASGSAGFYCRVGTGKPAGTGNMYNNWSGGGLTSGSCQVIVSAFTMRVAALDVALNGGTINSLSYGTLYYIFYDDPALAGGAAAMQATLVKETAGNSAGRFFVGSIFTPVAGGADTNGNNDGGGGAQNGALNQFDMSVDTVFTTGNGSVVNPASAIDGNSSTAAILTVTGNSAANIAQLVLTSAAAVRRKYSSLKLKIIARCATNTFTGTSTSFQGTCNAIFPATTTPLIAITLPGVTFIKQEFALDIPISTNISQIQVVITWTSGVPAASGVSILEVFKVWIDAVE